MSSLLSGACLTHNCGDCTQQITTVLDVNVTCECTCHPPLTRMEAA